MMENYKCGNCIFWLRDSSTAVQGICRRHAPRVVPEGLSKDVEGALYTYIEHDTIFPRTRESDWCGEWSDFFKIKLEG